MSAQDDPIVIRLGFQDHTNQQPFPPFNRLYEYNDFAARDVSVHRGDTVNFQTPPFAFNIVAIAADEGAARAAYPIVELNPADAPAPGTGLPAVSFSDGAFPVVGGSVNGGGEVHRDKGKGPPVVGARQFGQPPGLFKGGDAVEVVGPVVGWDLNQQPTVIDQLIVVDAPVLPTITSTCSIQECPASCGSSKRTNPCRRKFPWTRLAKGTSRRRES